MPARVSAAIESAPPRWPRCPGRMATRGRPGKMRLTSHGHDAGASELPDDGLERLHATFFERLKVERPRLLDLSVALLLGEVDRVPVLDELRSRAHRLSGT